MRVIIGIALACIQLGVSELVLANSLCSGPEFTDEQIAEVIRRERFVRTDLPAELPSSTATVRRQRCHYIYVESVGDSSRVFIVNQYGVIVDVLRSK
jgi:hypothetical protein